MHEQTEQCLRAVQAKDARFDGWFFTAVVTTGIYCRPSCPAMPKASNLRFFPTAAAAQAAGFRACKRCRPDASPGSPEWDARSDLVARAMRLIADGVVLPMELGHLPYRKGTFEDYLGIRGLEQRGKKKWRTAVEDAVARLVAALQPDSVVLGGGNVKKLKTLPPLCRAGVNANAFRGGFRLWEATDNGKMSVKPSRRSPRKET